MRKSSRLLLAKSPRGHSDVNTFWGQGPPNGNAGIKFTATAPPQGNIGTYSWVQLIYSDRFGLLDASYRSSCSGGPLAGNPELDTANPYNVVPTNTNGIIPNQPDMIG